MMKKFIIFHFIFFRFTFTVNQSGIPTFRPLTVCSLTICTLSIRSHPHPCDVENVQFRVRQWTGAAHEGLPLGSFRMRHGPTCVRQLMVFSRLSACVMDNASMNCRNWSVWKLSFVRQNLEIRLHLFNIVPPTSISKKILFSTGQ